jgi:phage-related protein
MQNIALNFNALYTLQMKEIIWQGSSYEDLRTFPDNARREAGFQLDKVQRGREPDNWKSMTTVGPGVREIRISDTSGIFRVIYVANIGVSVYVLHAFRKKTQKTGQRDIRLAKARFNAIKR